MCYADTQRENTWFFPSLFVGWSIEKMVFFCSPYWLSKQNREKVIFFLFSLYGMGTDPKFVNKRKNKRQQTLLWAVVSQQQDVSTAIRSCWVVSPYCSMPFRPSLYSQQLDSCNFNTGTLHCVYILRLSRSSSTKYGFCGTDIPVLDNVASYCSNDHSLSKRNSKIPLVRPEIILDASPDYSQ